MSDKTEKLSKGWRPPHMNQAGLVEVCNAEVDQVQDEMSDAYCSPEKIKEAIEVWWVYNKHMHHALDDVCNGQHDVVDKIHWIMEQSVSSTGDSMSIARAARLANDAATKYRLR